MSQNDTQQTEVFRKENEHGVEKEYVRVCIGTHEIELPKRVTNPTTGKTQDLTNLAEGGYCLKFLAAWHHFNSQTTVNLDEAPVLTLDKDKWQVEENDDIVVAKKRDPDTTFGEKLLEGDDA